MNHFNTNVNTNVNTCANANEIQAPGYKIIKLEDFLTGDNYNPTSPMYKNQPKITLDDVNPSLIKYLRNDEDYFNNNGNGLNNGLNNQEPIMNVKVNNSINNNVNNNVPVFKPLSSNTHYNEAKDKLEDKIDNSFLEDLIPKKIDFSKIDNLTSKKEVDKSQNEDVKVLSFTPTVKKNNVDKEDSLKFDSFRDHQSAQNIEDHLKDFKSL